MRKLAVVLALLVSAPASAHGPEDLARDVNAGMVLTLDAPETYRLGQTLTVGGTLRAAVGLPVIFETAAGVPDQRIDLMVDAAVIASTATGDDGSYSFDLTFEQLPPVTHTVVAYAYSGSALHTSSPSRSISPERVVLSMAIQPSNVSIAPGATVALRAFATYDDGREVDVTQRATWTSADPGIATVSSSEGTRGVVTGISPGATAISASLDGVVADAGAQVG